MIPGHGPGPVNCHCMGPGSGYKLQVDQPTPFKTRLESPNIFFHVIVLYLVLCCTFSVSISGPGHLYFSSVHLTMHD